MKVNDNDNSIQVRLAMIQNGFLIKTGGNSPLYCRNYEEVKAGLDAWLKAAFDRLTEKAKETQ